MTRRSFVTILVGLALLLIASTIRSGWLYLVASVLFAVVIMALVSGRLSVRRIELKREAANEVFESQPFDVRLLVKNKGRLACRLVSITDLQFDRARGGRVTRGIRERHKKLKEYLATGKSPAPTDGGARTGTVGIEELLPGETLTVSYEMTAPMRGVYPPAVMRIASGGVFGSGEVRAKVRAGEGVTVFPRVYPIENFAFDPMADQVAVDTVESARKGTGHDYYGIRPYVRGDSLKHVHWRSTARQGELIVKEYEREIRPSVVVVIALAAPSAGNQTYNSLEDGLRAAASVIDFHESNGGLPLLVLPEEDDFMPFEAHTLHGCYRKLAGYAAPSTPGDRSRWLAGGVRSAMRSMAPGASLVLVTNVAPLEAAAALGAFDGTLRGSLVLAVDDSYGRRWRSEWLAEAPWLAAFGNSGLRLYAVTAGREIGRCLSEPLNTIA